MNFDKGNETVAIERQDYEDKMYTILKDRTTYRVMQRDPTTSLQKKNK